MAGLHLRETLGALRDRIARLENRPGLAGHVSEAPGAGGDLLAAPAGLLHEVFTDEERNASASLGFALGSAQRLVSPARAAFVYLQLAKDAGQLGLPYGPGLAHFGIPPQAIVMGRIEAMPDLLWALEEAVACRAVAAVLADISGAPRALDFTASRRLSLRAGSAGTSIFILRYGIGRAASAAQLRWRVEPAPSGEAMFDPRAPAGPRFRVTLEKGRLANGPPALETAVLVDWTADGFVFAADRIAADRERPRAGPALHGPAPAALGNRLSQTG